MIIPAFSEELGMRNEEFTAGHPHPIYNYGERRKVNKPSHRRAVRYKPSPRGEGVNAVDG